MRHLTYKEIRMLVRTRKDNKSNHYVTKNEVKSILQDLDMRHVRSEVFLLYGFEEYNERHLVKSFYTYIGDKTFTEQVKQIKRVHEKFLQAILCCDVFPGLDRQDPLQSPDEDVIPDKY